MKMKSGGAQALISATGRGWWEDQEFKVALSYLAKLRTT